MADEWRRFAVANMVGQEVDGVISSVSSFGAIVDVQRGIEGHLHVTEIATPPPNAPADVVTVGQAVRARIVTLQPERRTLVLSLLGLTQPAGQPTPPKQPNIDSPESVAFLREGPVLAIFKDDPLGDPGLSADDALKMMSGQQQSGPDTDAIDGPSRSADSDWEVFVASHAIGDLVSGSITGVTRFGVTVKLSPPAVGFAHMTKIDGWQAYEEARPSRFVVGSQITARIVALEASARTVGLAIPWRDAPPETPSMVADLPDDDPDPFAPTPLDRAVRRAGLNLLADEIRSALPGMESQEREALEERWAELRSANTEDVFHRLAAEVRQALAQGSPESEGDASD